MKLYRKISLFVLALVLFTFAASNDSTIDSAVLKRIYMGNYSYNTCLSSQPILSMRWASDLNRPVWKNKSNVIYKGMIDASTTANTPQYRVWFADSIGRATNSSVFTYTNGTLFAPWVKGDSIATTGKVSGASGVFSGRVTGTDLDVSDSVKGVTGTFTGAIAGATLNTGNGDNELYPMNQPVLTTSDPTFDSTNATVINTTRSRTETGYSDSVANTGGISTARLTLNGLMTINRTNGTVPAYISIYEGTTLLSIIGVSRNDGSGIITGALSNSLVVRNENKPIIFAMGVSPKITLDTTGYMGIGTTSPQYPLHVVGDIYASTKVLTDTVRSTSGNGRLVLDDDNEILLWTSQAKVSADLRTPKISYALHSGTGAIYRDSINNNILIGQPVASAHDAAVVINLTSPDSSLVIRSDGTMKIRNMPMLDTGTVTLTWAGFTGTVTSDVFYQRVGYQVTLFLPYTTGTSNSTQVTSSGLPSSIRPVSSMYVGTSTQVLDNGSYIPNEIMANIESNGNISLYRGSGTSNWTASNDKGWTGTCFTYLIK